MESENQERIEYCRRFLVDELPEPMTPADAHLQFFDNYVEGTSIRLRAIRDPKTKLWVRRFEKRIAVSEAGIRSRRISSIELNDTEYQAFQSFEGREIRKNRYFSDENHLRVSIDIFLGKLWGLNIAQIVFPAEDALKEFVPTKYFGFEVTEKEFFDGENLVSCVFSDVQSAYAKMMGG